MIKKIVSMLLPSNEKLARKAAEGVRDGINGTDEEKKAVITKYATLGNECAAIGQSLTDILKDGNVDDVETEQLAKFIEPLIAKAREIIGI